MLTRIFYPNIDSSTGTICVDVLQNKWVPAMSVGALFMSIVAFLSEPEPKSPLNEEAARLMRKGRRAYYDEAREWTKKYAM